MDIEGIRDRLGDEGEKGALLLAAGLLAVATQNKRIAVGVAIVVAGLGLVARGVVKGTLEEFGMGGML